MEKTAIPASTVVRTAIAGLDHQLTTIVTDAGRVINGIIAAESGGAVVADAHGGEWKRAAGMVCFQQRGDCSSVG